MIGREITYEAGRTYSGAISTLMVAPDADHIGEVQAWRVDTGKRVWTHTFAQSANWGPMLATGGGLVFSGGTNDRVFRAFDPSRPAPHHAMAICHQLGRHRPAVVVHGRMAAGTSPCSRDGASTRGRCRRVSTGCFRGSTGRARGWRNLGVCLGVAHAHSCEDERQRYL